MATVLKSETQAPARSMKWVGTRSIDTSRAEALPGVKAVITRDDFQDLPSEFVPAGEMLVNYRDMVRNVMAREKVLYEGHPVAAGAAISAKIANEALKLIEVEY